MNPPPFLYAEVSEIDSGNDPLRVWVDGQPGAVPYMLARPMPIETAPRDGTAILAYIPYEDGGNWWPTHWDCGWRAIDGPGGRASHWLPLPPAPEEA